MGYPQQNVKVEKFYAPEAMKILQLRHPNRLIRNIPSYSKGNGTYMQKTLQGAGADDIIYDETKSYIEYIYDEKGYMKWEYFTALLIEIETGYTYVDDISKVEFNKPIEVDPYKIYNKSYGWSAPKILDRGDGIIVPSQNQSIIQICQNEAYVFNKARLQYAIHKCPDIFNPDLKACPLVAKQLSDEEMQTGKIKLVRNVIVRFDKHETLAKFIINAKYQRSANHWYKIKM